METTARKYFNSIYFLITVCFFAFIFWTFNFREYGIILIGLLGISSLFFCEDLRALIAAVVIGIMAINKTSTSFNLFILIPLAVIVIATAAAGIVVFYRRNIKGTGFKLNKGYLFLGFCLAVLAGLLGGMFYPYFNRLLLFRLIFKCSVVYAVYFIGVNFLKPDSKSYFAKMIMIAVFVIFFEAVVRFSREASFWEAVKNKQSKLGWGNHNIIAHIVCMAIPMSAYLAATEKRHNLIYALLMFVDFAIILFLFSRSNMLIGSFAIFVSMIYLCFWTKKFNKYHFIGACTAAVLMVIVFFGAFYLKAGSNWWNGFLDQMDNGRLDLYAEGFALFKKNILFGAGLYIGDGVENAANYGYGIWLLHSTPVTILACFGIVGALLFIPFFFQRYKLLLKFNNNYSFFVFLTIFSFELYGVIDVGLTHLYLNMYAFLFLALCEINQKNPTEFPLQTPRAKIR